MADVYKSLDDIILQTNRGPSGNRGSWVNAGLRAQPRKRPLIKKAFFYAKEGRKDGIDIANKGFRREAHWKIDARGRGRGRGNRRGGMRGGSRGGGRIITQGGMQQGGKQGGRGGGMQGGRGNRRGRGGGFRGARGRGARGGGGNRLVAQQNVQNIQQMPNPKQVGQSLARQATFRPQQTISVKLPDAREKLNMKARQTDARMRLNKKVQQTDARFKLNAKRRFSGDGPANVGGQQQQQQQGQISRNMGNLGLTQVTIRNPGAQLKPAPTQITIRNPQAKQQGGAKKNKGGNVISLKKQTAGNTVGLGQGGGLKITTVNQAATLKRRAAPVAVRSRESLDDYIMPAKVKRQMIPVTPPTTSGIARIKPPPVLAPAPAAPRISALERVSAPRVPRVSSPPVIQGTRIIISNLHPVVTEEDIKELFGAIGTLVRARLVRPGLAEVIYTKREQALQAITTYHDRELDGQPMQCKLDTSTVPETRQQPLVAAKPKTTGMVTAATVAAASAAAQQKPSSLSDRFKLYSRSNVDLPTSGMRSDSLPQSQDRSIDPSVIHKALFKTGAQTNPSKPVLFTVKI